MKFLATLLPALLLTISLQAQQFKAPAPFGPLPTQQQLAWYKMEYNAFIHFTINTFTNKEWGDGGESEMLFRPTAFNPGQWIETLKQAGFKGIILTAKHHDGFCLWPSQYALHNISKSPYQNGKGDVVKEVSDATQKAGLKFGVYLSPWDRNAASYGKPGYLQLYRNQLSELLTKYGNVFEFWMDGANGGNGYYGGANEVRKIDRKTYYQWPTAIALARRLQPSILLFSDAGPDLRWCGTETGRAGDPNWNTITLDTLYPGFTNSENLLQHGDPNGKHWAAAEVDVSIRPGWFWHAKEDSLVKTPEQLFNLYLSSVGRGAVLLLNIPPDTTGNFHPTDVQSLLGFKRLLNERLGKNLAAGAKAIASTWRGHQKQYSAAMLTDGKENTYWTTEDSLTTASIEIDLGKQQTAHFITLQEYIALGQRIETFTIEALVNGEWQKLADGTTVGYKRILQIRPLQTNKLRITITGAKACPLLSNVAVY